MPLRFHPVAARSSLLLVWPLVFAAQPAMAQERTFPLVDTMQDRCFDTAGTVIACPAAGESLFGQDAHYARTASSYADNGDGTVTDTVTSLVWQQTPGNDRLQFADAIGYCQALELGGRSDWRVPTITELYSLADFRGELLRPEDGEPRPYLDTSVFDFEYPQPPRVTARRATRSAS